MADQDTMTDQDLMTRIHRLHMDRTTQMMNAKLNSLMSSCLLAQASSGTDRSDDLLAVQHTWSDVNMARVRTLLVDEPAGVRPVDASSHVWAEFERELDEMLERLDGGPSLSRELIRATRDVANEAGRQLVQAEYLLTVL